MKENNLMFHCVAVAFVLPCLPAFSQDESMAGNLTVAGWARFGGGIDVGPEARHTLDWDQNGLRVTADVNASQGAFVWRDSYSLANGLESARNKMLLDVSNVLSLYKPDGATPGLVLDPSAGKITLPNSGGLFFGSGTTATLAAAPNGSAVFPASVTLQNGLQLAAGTLNIASTTPATATTGALTLAGGASIGSDSWINGVRVGRGANGKQTNTVLGNNSLGSTSSSLGDFNTAVGASALMRNTTGYQNSSFGPSSLEFNTSGAWNSAFGTYSLYANTGSQNTAYGSKSLFRLSSGSNNVALGYAAGELQKNGMNLTSAYNSIFIGANSRGGGARDYNAIVIGANAIGEGSHTTVIGTPDTVKTQLYGTVNASGFTVNQMPVLTPQFGVGSTLSNDALLAIGGGATSTRSGAIAIGGSSAVSGESSVALGELNDVGDSRSMAMGYANGVYGTDSYAIGQYNIVEPRGGVILGEYNQLTGVNYGGVSIGSNNGFQGHAGECSMTLGVGSTAIGNYSTTMGMCAVSYSYMSTALGSGNIGGGDGLAWVETDPLFELGNREWGAWESIENRSNAITTLKNGRTTLTNKAWKADPSVPPSDANSNCEALVVEGHSRMSGNTTVEGAACLNGSVTFNGDATLKGRVSMEQAQGDISMGNYQ